MNNNAKKFQDKYKVIPTKTHMGKTTQFDPNIEAAKIAEESLIEFTELVKGTPNEQFIAFKDPKVQELVDFVTAAIILENERINAPDAFPIQIYRRYKADGSLKNKMEQWSSREEKQDMPVTDYLGFKIIPEAEHSIFFSDGDKKLQKMIEKNERIRSFIAHTYQYLSDKPKITFEEYTRTCVSILRELYRCFPREATDRRKFYQNKIKQIQLDLANYSEMFENPNVPITLQDISDLTDINIKQLLRELNDTYSNELCLYKLHSDLMNTFEKSELLKFLGISVSDDPTRTKRKSTKNGYRSEFIGLDLSIILDEATTLDLPIECQVQTSEQYRDGNVGFSAHTKLPTKSIKLKNVPSLGDGQQYTDPKGELTECKEFLKHVMHITPTCAIAKTTGNDFETGRIMITPYDLYEAFRLVSRVPKDNSAIYKTYNKYLGELYTKREQLFPTGKALLPKYIREEDIPNLNSDITKYRSFFNELAGSLKNTFEGAKVEGLTEKTNTGISPEPQEEIEI